MTSIPLTGAGPAGSGAPPAIWPNGGDGDLVLNNLEDREFIQGLSYNFANGTMGTNSSWTITQNPDDASDLPVYIGFSGNLTLGLGFSISGVSGDGTVSPVTGVAPDGYVVYYEPAIGQAYDGGSNGVGSSGGSASDGNGGGGAGSVGSGTQRFGGPAGYDQAGNGGGSAGGDGAFIYGTIGNSSGGSGSAPGAGSRGNAGNVIYIRVKGTISFHSTVAVDLPGQDGGSAGLTVSTGAVGGSGGGLGGFGGYLVVKSPGGTGICQAGNLNLNGGVGGDPSLPKGTGVQSFQGDDGESGDFLYIAG